jgi:hypothetical protein
MREAIVTAAGASNDDRGTGAVEADTATVRRVVRDGDTHRGRLMEG